MKNRGNQNFGKNVATIDINLDDMVVTYRTVTRVVMSIVEFLSFNRQQIPMVYETFNHLTNKLENRLKTKANQADCTEVKNFALERQQELAIKTNQQFRDISDVSEL